MAKIKVQSSVKIDALGKWQNKILETIKKALPGSKVGFAPLPMGRAALVVYWDGFEGKDILGRQDIVRRHIERLNADASRRVSMLLTLTTEEAAGVEDP